MTFLHRTYRKYKTGLDIKNGVLIKCGRTEGNIVIPDEVEAVYHNAFVDCEDVRIDRSEAYISERLTKAILNEMTKVEAEFLDYDSLAPDYSDHDGYNPLLTVSGAEITTVGEALDKVLQIKNNKPGLEWQLVSIDANEIPMICNDKDYIKSLTHKDGYGVLCIRNLNLNNYKTVSCDFFWDILYHIFCNVPLNQRWLVVLEIDRILPSKPTVRLVIKDGTYFDSISQRFIKPDEYIKEMEYKRKVITDDMLWDAYFTLHKKTD